MIAICTDNLRAARETLGDRVASFRLAASQGKFTDGSEFIIVRLVRYEDVNRFFIGMELKGIEIVGSPNERAVERLRVQVRP